MEPVVFSARSSGRWTAVLIWSPLGVASTVAAFYFVGVLDGPGRDLSPSLTWLPAAQAVLAVAAVLLVPVLIVGQIRLAAPERNFLRIDETGLTFARFGKSRTWVWPELSPFERDHSFARIKFLLPDLEPERARRDRWVHEVTPKGAMVVVRDIYDAPLDEITAKLNDYRDRALADAPRPA